MPCCPRTRVEAHLASVVEQTGGVDVSFNMIGIPAVQGQELSALSLDDYLQPIELGARAHFITATAAARHMTDRGSGVIMAITATPSRLALPLVGGFGTANSAIEGMLRTLAAEACACLLAAFGRLAGKLGSRRGGRCRRSTHGPLGHRLPAEVETRHLAEALSHALRGRRDSSAARVRPGKCNDRRDRKHHLRPDCRLTAVGETCRG